MTNPLTAQVIAWERRKSGADQAWEDASRDYKQAYEDAVQRKITQEQYQAAKAGYDQTRTRYQAFCAAYNEFYQANPGLSDLVEQVRRAVIAGEAPPERQVPVTRPFPQQPPAGPEPRDRTPLHVREPHPADEFLVADEDDLPPQSAPATAGADYLSPSQSAAPGSDYLAPDPPAPANPADYLSAPAAPTNPADYLSPAPAAPAATPNPADYLSPAPAESAGGGDYLSPAPAESTGGGDYLSPAPVDAGPADYLAPGPAQPAGDDYLSPGPASDGPPAGGSDYLSGGAPASDPGAYLNEPAGSANPADYLGPSGGAGAADQYADVAPTRGYETDDEMQVEEQTAPSERMAWRPALVVMLLTVLVAGIVSWPVRWVCTWAVENVIDSTPRFVAMFVALLLALVAAAATVAVRAVVVRFALGLMTRSGYEIALDRAITLMVVIAGASLPWTALGLAGSFIGWMATVLALALGTWLLPTFAQQPGAGPPPASGGKFQQRAIPAFLALGLVMMVLAFPSAGAGEKQQEKPDAKPAKQKPVKSDDAIDSKLLGRVSSGSSLEGQRLSDDDAKEVAGYLFSPSQSSAVKVTDPLYITLRGTHKTDVVVASFASIAAAEDALTALQEQVTEAQGLPEIAPADEAIVYRVDACAGSMARIGRQLVAVATSLQDGSCAASGPVVQRAIDAQHRQVVESLSAEL